MNWVTVAWSIGRRIFDGATPDEADEYDTLPSAGLEGLSLVETHSEAAALALATGKRHQRWLLRRELETVGVDGVRLGDKFYRIQRPKEWVVVDWLALSEWIDATATKTGQHPGMIWGRLFPSNQIRVSALRQAADVAGASREAVEGTFVAHVEKRDRNGDKKDADLEVLPIGKAPKFAQRLDHGEPWKR